MGPGNELRAWRPRLPGVVEVLHAHFTDHAYPMHAHDAWTVLLVDSGAVRYDLDRHEHGAVESVVTLLPPHVPHNGTSALADGFRKRVLYLSRDQLPDRLVGASVGRPELPSASLRRTVSSLHRAVLSPDLYAETLLISVLSDIRGHFGLFAGENSDEPTIAYRLRDLLEANIVDGISLRDAAASLERDASHLVRSFTSTFGMSPHRYLTSRRVDLARRLILDGRPLAAVATEAGFYDQAHLTRHFKRLLGTSPGRFAYPL